MTILQRYFCFSLITIAILASLGQSTGTTKSFLKNLRATRQNKLNQAHTQTAAAAAAASTAADVDNNCNCGIFLTGQFNHAKKESPKENPVLMQELQLNLPCTPAGQKMCTNKCVDTIIKHLPSAQDVICAMTDRDIYKERAYLFIQNCGPLWINSNLSAGREFCCLNGKSMKCNAMTELLKNEQEKSSTSTTEATVVTKKPASKKVAKEQ